MSLGDRLALAAIQAGAVVWWVFRASGARRVRFTTQLDATPPSQPSPRLSSQHHF